MNNTQKLFQQFMEAGYEIVREEYVQSGDEIYELELTFERIDGQPIRFLKEWDEIKKLASKQYFYVMPINQELPKGHADEGAAAVYLIKKSMVYKVGQSWIDVLNVVTSSYWYIQEDQLLSDLVGTGVNLSMSINGIYSGMRRMKTGTAHEYYFENHRLLEIWHKYKEKLGVLCYDVEEFYGEKLPKEAIDGLKAIKDLYAL